MKMTSKRADIVRALKSGPAEYLMIRPMASVPAHRRQTLLSGAKLVVLVDGEAQEPKGVPAASAMAAHRYDVQAAVYLLALHRLLQARLGSRYDPAQHLGGAVYFFLRGIHGPAGGVCTLTLPTEALQALDAMLDAAATAV